MCPGETSVSSGIAPRPIRQAREAELSGRLRSAVNAGYLPTIRIRLIWGFGRGDVLSSRPLATVSVATSHRAQPLPICRAGGSRDRGRGGRGRTGDLCPCRPGPTPAEPPRGSANVKIAQGKGNPEGNRTGTGTGQRPKGTNRRTPDEGKPEEGGRRGGTRRANGKPEESPQGNRRT